MDEVLAIAVRVLSSDRSLFKIENPSEVLKQCSCSISLPASDNSRQLHFSNPGKLSMSIGFSSVSTVLQVKTTKQKAVLRKILGCYTRINCVTRDACSYSTDMFFSVLHLFSNLFNNAI